MDSSLSSTSLRIDITLLRSFSFTAHAFVGVVTNKTRGYGAAFAVLSMQLTLKYKSFVQLVGDNTNKGINLRFTKFSKLRKSFFP
jgi:hypothetical protein